MGIKNPFKLMKIYLKAQTLLSRFEDAKADRERHTADPERASYASASWWRDTLDVVRELVLALPVPNGVQSMFLKNWKTTLAGVSAVLAIASKIAMTGQFDWSIDGPALIAAVGLIVAKDGNVTGVATK